MSIYPVRLADWYPKDNEMHFMMRIVVEHNECLTCGKPVKWWRAVGHHSIPWGYGNVWCNEKCLNKKEKV